MRIPKYRLHKSSGLAVVEIHGKPIYLGKHDSEESRRKYREIIATFVATGGPPDVSKPALTVGEAVARFRLARLPELDARERQHVEAILVTLTALFEPHPLETIGPVRYEAARASLVARGWSRQYVNAQCGRLKQILKWLVGRELYPADKLSAIREVPNLRRGAAPESVRRQPAPLADVLATLPHLPSPVAGLVQFQLYTGCRPGEAVVARREEIDTAGLVRWPNGSTTTLAGLWVYSPPRHKKAHRGESRIILIGPKGQEALSPFLDSPGYLFRPADVAKAPRPGPRYRVDSYGRAILAGCKRAKVAPWSAYQLRHLVAGIIRDSFGLEHVKEVLGHANVSMSEHYANVGILKAAAAIRAVG